LAAGFKSLFKILEESKNKKGVAKNQVILTPRLEKGLPRYKIKYTNKVFHSICSKKGTSAALLRTAPMYSPPKKLLPS